MLENTGLKNTDDKETKHNPEKKQTTQKNKTTLVQSPITTLGQETRRAYSTMLPSPHGAQYHGDNRNISLEQ